MGFVVDKEALGQVFSEYLYIPPIAPHLSPSAVIMYLFTVHPKKE
jgi:hypothetical protein